MRPTGRRANRKGLPAKNEPYRLDVSTHAADGGVHRGKVTTVGDESRLDALDDCDKNRKTSYPPSSGSAENRYGWPG